MRKGVTLLETLIVVFLAGLIMPFLFRLITMTCVVLGEELNHRKFFKEDLDYVINKQNNYLDSTSLTNSLNYFIVSGSVLERLVILGEK